MQLKLRPMSEAPLGVPLIVSRNHGNPELRTLSNSYALGPEYSGFWILSDLLRAAEILAGITPEGWELTGDLIKTFRGDTSDKWTSGVHCEQYAILAAVRRIAPPVEYEYVTDQKYRFAKVGDFLLQGDGEWVEVDESLARVCADAPRLCFRRVEVK